MNRKANISFLPINEYISNNSPSPKPSRKYFPDFMKEMPHTVHTIHGVEATTATKCAPFTDAFVSGYTQELHCDVKIKYEGHQNGEDLFTYTWSDRGFQPIGTRLEHDGMENLFPHFSNYYNAEFQWNSAWEPSTPKGWSTMYHHPSNRPDLPFFTLTGIIDTDRWSVHGPVPFILKDGFEGIIPAGTPIYQMTPIKRQDWVSEVMDFDADEQNARLYEGKKKFNGYRKLMWGRKSFI